MADEITLPQNYPDAENPRPELSAEPVNKKPLIIGIIVAVVLVLLFGGIGVLLFYNPAAAAVLRDIFIIFLGLGVFVVILLLVMLVVITAYLVLKVNDLTQLLDREIRPVLGKLQDTTTTIGGTATFISEKAVQPVISTASMAAGVSAIFRALFKRK
ncbi:MAG: hypothetical protein KDJ65_06420 [Anaerolineae bacterium]|nr:hypothetical protein [Anaerolineae bacterium]